MSNQERSLRSCRLRERSASTFDRPTRKKPSVTFTASPASGVPRACSLDFIKMPGTLPTPPPSKFGGRMKVNSAVWLAGSDESVLRRNDIVILNLRSGMSMSARTARSPGVLPEPLICSVRHTTVPTYCLPLGSDGSSSYSATRCATGATVSEDGGWPTRSAIFFCGGAVVSLGASTTVEGFSIARSEEYSDGPHRIAAPARINTTPTAIALLNGKPPPTRGGRGALLFTGLFPGRERGGSGGGVQREVSPEDSSKGYRRPGSAPRFSMLGSSRSNSGEGDGTLA